MMTIEIKIVPIKWDKFMVKKKDDGTMYFIFSNKERIKMLYALIKVRKYFEGSYWSTIKALFLNIFQNNIVGIRIEDTDKPKTPEKRKEKRRYTKKKIKSPVRRGPGRPPKKRGPGRPPKKK